MRAASSLGRAVARHARVGGARHARDARARPATAPRGASAARAMTRGPLDAARGDDDGARDANARGWSARDERGGARDASDGGPGTRDAGRDARMRDAGEGEGRGDVPQLRVTAPGRVVAIGDLHGDIGQARRALRTAGVLDDEDDAGNPRWVGGDTTLVQLGDILDRGDDEIGILILLQKLDKEAQKQGGRVYVMNGNHEVLNVSGDFRYVSRGAFGESTRFSQHLVKLFGDKFRDAFGVDEEDAWARQSKARIGLFSPGGPLAQQLSMHHTVLIVNDTVFAHGGLVPSTSNSASISSTER